MQLTLSHFVSFRERSHSLWHRSCSRGCPQLSPSFGLRGVPRAFSAPAPGTVWSGAHHGNLLLLWGKMRPRGRLPSTLHQTSRVRLKMHLATQRLCPKSSSCIGCIEWKRAWQTIEGNTPRYWQKIKRIEIHAIVRTFIAEYKCNRLAGL